MSDPLAGSLVGSVAGAAATVPMTLVMDTLHRGLPAEHQDPLPPRQITEAAADKVGALDQLEESSREQLTLAAHFAYGAGMGALYGLLASQVRLPPVASGVGFGLAVWAASYFGLLPAARLYRSPGEEPTSRHALMLTAHVVWGGSLGMLNHLLLEQLPNGQRRGEETPPLGASRG